MKLITNTKKLSEVLNEAGRFISTKPSTPVLSGIFLEVKDGQLQVRTSNGQALYVLQTPIEAQEEGSCIVSGPTLLSVIKALDASEVELETQLEQLVIRQKGATFEVALLTFPEFPNLLSPQGAQTLHFPTESFVQAVKQVFVSASLDETKPVLTSVMLELSQPNSLVTTDGFRLYRLETDLSVNETGALLFPSKSLREVLGLLEKHDQAVFDISWNTEKTHVTFAVGNKTVQMSIIQGDFPEYKAIIPAACAFSYTVDREQLIARVKQAMIFAKDVSSIVIFSIENTELVVESQVSARGKTKTTLEVHNLEGDPVKFACNGKYVLDFLQSVDALEVSIQGNESLKPVLFGVRGQEALLYLVMPFKLSQ